MYKDNKVMGNIHITHRGLVLLLVPLILLSPDLVRSQITDGPAASVSILSASDFTNIRSCAAHCLWYNGDQGFGNKIDAAGALGCGGDTAATNGCYCSTRFTSSATSFISSCVTLLCGTTIQDIHVDESGAISLYNGYCATANVAVAVTGDGRSVTSTAVETSKSMPNGQTMTSSSSASPTSQAFQAGTGSKKSSTFAGGTSSAASSAHTSSSSQVSSSTTNNGLSKSAVTAIGVAAGIGIPIIVLLSICIYFITKRRSPQPTPPMAVVPAPMSRFEDKGTIQAPLVRPIPSHATELGTTQFPHSQTGLPTELDAAQYPRPHELR